jgi:hypothetical protein
LKEAKDHKRYARVNGSSEWRYGELCMIPINPSIFGKMRELALVVGDM